MGYKNYYKQKTKYRTTTKEWVHDVLNKNILQSKNFQYEKLLQEQTDRIKTLEQEISDLKQEIEMLKAINQEC
jgi:SMC interacting uncharacterized protein involved in chromosome segregation